MAQFLARALRWLGANADIAEWVTCYVTGDPIVTACVLNRLTGRTAFQIEIREDGAGGDADAGDDPFGVQRTSKRMSVGAYYVESRYLDLYRDDPNEHACLEMIVASTILHEFLHQCDTTGIYADGAALYRPGPCVCHEAYILGNSFLYVASQRYPCVQKGASCSFARNPQLWLHDGRAAPNIPPWGDCDSR